MTQYTVLLALSREGGMSGAQLARACGVTQETMATVLTGLQNKDLIERRPSRGSWTRTRPAAPTRLDRALASAADRRCERAAHLVDLRRVVASDALLTTTRRRSTHSAGGPVAVVRRWGGRGGGGWRL
ncbi:MarR family transcriptional regulator [Actinomadura bangladeshensis]|uniref:MarR family transcriptional regulator n=1 Tax=Actinomadura bangladeshensis TaxID=453573 RepID=UPI001EF3BCAC|nr:MarR family transcriptional regulator [Actinomadura bangladeshensis]